MNSTSFEGWAPLNDARDKFRYEFDKIENRSPGLMANPFEITAKVFQTASRKGFLPLTGAFEMNNHFLQPTFAILLAPAADPNLQEGAFYCPMKNFVLQTFHRVLKGGSPPLIVLHRRCPEKYGVAINGTVHFNNHGRPDVKSYTLVAVILWDHEVNHYICMTLGGKHDRGPPSILAGNEYCWWLADDLTGNGVPCLGPIYEFGQDLAMQPCQFSYVKTDLVS